MDFTQETLEMARKRAADLESKFVEEVQRLLRSGAVDPDDHNRAALFGVALENIADDYLRTNRQSATYRALKRF